MSPHFNCKDIGGLGARPPIYIREIGVWAPILTDSYWAAGPIYKGLGGKAPNIDNLNILENNVKCGDIVSNNCAAQRSNYCACEVISLLQGQGAVGPQAYKQKEITSSTNCLAGRRPKACRPISNTMQLLCAAAIAEQIYLLKRKWPQAIILAGKYNKEFTAVQRSCTR